MEHLKGSDHASHHEAHAHVATEHLLASSQSSHSNHPAHIGRSLDVRYDAAGHAESLNVDAAHLYNASYHQPERRVSRESEHGRAEHRHQGAAEHRPLQGIDVYWRNGHLDWHRLKADHVDFAYLKASEGADLQDRAFHRNWQESGNAGITHGAYHLFRPQKSVQSQVQNFVSSVGHLRRGDLPPVLDLEPSKAWARSNPRDNANKVVAWLQAVEHRLGVKPMVYVNSNIIHNALGNDRRLTNYPLWLARPQGHRPEAPRPYNHYAMWQYSWHGRLPGVHHALDRDLYFGSREQLERGELA